MALPERPDPVKRILVLLWSDAVILERARERCENLWGTVDYEGEVHDFAGFHRLDGNRKFLDAFLAERKARDLLSPLQ